MSDEVDVESAQYDGTLNAERGPIPPALRYDGDEDKPWKVVSGNTVLADFEHRGDAEQALDQALSGVAEHTAERAATANEGLVGAATPDESSDDE